MTISVVHLRDGVAFAMRMPHIGRETAGMFLGEEVAEQLERIFAGVGFRRSDRLQSFLRYICDLTVKGESERINEYLLATEVFHRRSDFASNSVSTVRRQAHLLKKNSISIIATKVVLIGFSSKCRSVTTFPSSNAG